MATPSQDPYLFPHLYMQDNISSNSSLDDFYDTSPEFPPKRDSNTYQYYSDDSSQNHTNPLPDFSNFNVGQCSDHGSSIRRHVTPSSGRRFGLSLDTRVVLPVSHVSPNINLDLNLPPPQTNTLVGRDQSVHSNNSRDLLLNPSSPKPTGDRSTKSSTS